LTPLVLNTLDSGNPTSSVEALPATTPGTSIEIHWDGQDEAHGSGIAGYDVFVSIDGGAFGMLVEDTTETFALLAAEPGRTYRFYSIATDNVGHREMPPLVPDTQTLFIGGDGSPPTVTNVIIQEGATQRSFIDQLEIVFDEEMAIEPLITDGSIVDVVSLVNLGINADDDDDMPVTLSTEQFHYTFDADSGISKLTWSLDTFAGGTVSLTDGIYELHLDRAFITDVAGTFLDGDGDGLPIDDFRFQFHRLQGDANGDMTVDDLDMDVVNAALGSQPGYSEWDTNADLDRDGRVTIRDRLLVFRADGNEIILPVLPIIADFDADGDVDGNDLPNWQIGFGTQTNAAAQEGDADGDGDVDGYDFLTWQIHLGNSTRAAAVVEQPLALVSNSEGMLPTTDSADSTLLAVREDTQAAVDVFVSLGMGSSRSVTDSDHSPISNNGFTSRMARMNAGDRLFEAIALSETNNRRIDDFSIRKRHIRHFLESIQENEDRQALDRELMPWAGRDRRLLYFMKNEPRKAEKTELAVDEFFSKRRMLESLLSKMPMIE
jgi:Dockerin type I domain